MAMAKMTKKDEDITASFDGLTEKKIDVLANWEKKFEAYRLLAASGYVI